MSGQGSCGCREAVPLAAGSQGGCYQEGSSSREKSLWPSRRNDSSAVNTDPNNQLQQLPRPGEHHSTTKGCFLTPGATQRFGAGAAKAGKCPGGASPHPSSPAPRSAGEGCHLPHTVGPCTQREQQSSLSLPTNLFQFIKLTNRG